MGACMKPPGSPHYQTVREAVLDPCSANIILNPSARVLIVMEIRFGAAECSLAAGMMLLYDCQIS